MPLPSNATFTGTSGSSLPSSHPAGTFLFQGHQIGMGRTSTGGMGMTTMALNVFGKKHGGQQVFCVEKVFTSATGTVTQTHTWKTEGEYAAEHRQLWRDFDMEPNRDFNIGAGLRSEGGEHLGGSNELCDRDGTLKPANIRERCT